MASDRSALVVGAGVQGLTTAVVLVERGWQVRIRSEERPENTTSAAAGAMWGPAMLHPVDRVRQWGSRSYPEFVSLAQDEDTGVHLCPGMMAARFDFGSQVPPEVTLLPDLRRCLPGELPAGYLSGYRGTVPLIHMARYLRYLTDRFLAAGGEITLGPVASLAEATDESPVVINCAGVGAHEFVADPGVRPIWGQTVVVANPGLREYFIEPSMAETFVGWVPHGDQLMLGGVAIEHAWDSVPSPEHTEGILRRCAEVEPRLRDAEVLAELVGLRPGRDSVRVAAEDFRGARVVHNYGHAGAGVSLSWGCAFEAADLAETES